jgi:hypothetical protein
MSIMRPNQRSAHQTDAPLTTTVHVTNFRALTRDYQAALVRGEGEYRLAPLRREIARIGNILMQRATMGDIEAQANPVGAAFVECDLWS